MALDTTILDPIALELFRHKFNAITEEMGIALGRTALSSYVKETQDFGTALCNLEGKFFACPSDTGIAIGTDMDCSMMIAAFDDYRPGDVIVTNHPYHAAGVGSHLPDINLLQPYFHEGELVCFGWSFAHCADVGGAVASSISPSFDNIFQEGLQIPPIRFYEAGRRNESFVAILSSNSRVPDIALGDLQAQLAALAVGERRVTELIEQSGVAAFKAARQGIVDYASERALAVQKRIPDGEYVFWDYLDDDFRSRIPVRFRCRMTVNRGHIHLDLDGTDPQLASPYNVPTGGRRHPYFTSKIMHLLYTYDRDLPLNSGLFNNITVSVPSATVMNPESPAAVGIRHAGAVRFADVLLGCLSQADPSIAPAASSGTVIPVVVASTDTKTGKRAVSVMQSLAGGAGGTSCMDGADGRDRSLANIRNTPTERGESDVAVRVETYMLRPDSGGAGKFRGGAGIVYSLRVLKDGIEILGRGLERFTFSPWGTHGGLHGEAARVVLNMGTEHERELGKIDIVRPNCGDVLTIMTPGGGGWGDPLERDPARVARDVVRGLVSIPAALEQYGVVLDEHTRRVDDAATQQRREALAARGAAVAHGPARGFDSVRRCWEAVFDDASMNALVAALLAAPASNRTALRARVFEAVAPGVTTAGARVLGAADFDVGAARTRLADAIHTLADTGQFD